MKITSLVLLWKIGAALILLVGSNHGVAGRGHVTGQDRDALIEKAIAFPGKVQQDVFGTISSHRGASFTVPDLVPAPGWYRVIDETGETRDLEVINIVQTWDEMQNDVKAGLSQKDQDNTVMAWMEENNFQSFAFEGVFHEYDSNEGKHVVAVASTTTSMGTDYSLTIAYDATNDPIQSLLQQETGGTQTRELQDDCSETALELAIANLNCAADPTMDETCITTAQDLYQTQAQAASDVLATANQAISELVAEILAEIEKTRILDIVGATASCAAQAVVTGAPQEVQQISFDVCVAEETETILAIELEAVENAAAAEASTIGIATDEFVRALAEACTNVVANVELCLECSVLPAPEVPDANTVSPVPTPAPTLAQLPQTASLILTRSNQRQPGRNYKRARGRPVRTRTPRKRTRRRHRQGQAGDGSVRRPSRGGAIRHRAIN